MKRSNCMAKYFLAVSIMVCAGLLGAASAQEPAPQPKPQEKATQQKPAEKTPQPKVNEQTQKPAEQKPAEKPAQPKTEEQAQKPALAQPAGEVVSIDAMKNELVIKDNAGVETHLMITASTTITKGGKSIT